MVSQGSVLPKRDPAMAAEATPMVVAARLRDPGSGRAMEISTTAPAIQVHTANNIDGEVPLWLGKGGAVYQKQGPKTVLFLLIDGE